VTCIDNLTPMRRIVTMVTAGILGLSVPVACGSSESRSDGPTTSTRPAPSASPADVDRALGRAIAWSAANLGTTDAFTLAFADYVGRRYGITEFATARALARQKAATEQAATQPDLRLVDPSARVAPAALTEQARPAFMLLRGGLACGDPGTPPDFEQRLRAAIVAGDYDLTHAAFALGVERELGCPPTGGEALRQEMVDALEQSIEKTKQIDDLAVERMSGLVYIGGKLPAAAVSAVVAAQRPDGSFAAPDEGTERHLAAFATWALASAAPARAGSDPNARLILAG
jgi:hypothetical protein